MRLLLDTHILIWQLVDDPRLTPRLRSAILDPTNERVVSDVSLWEIAIKMQSGKLTLELAEVEREIAAYSYVRLAIARAHIRMVSDLAKAHGDPFDHLLIAQAMAEDMAILTTDRVFKQYPARLA